METIFISPTNIELFPERRCRIQRNAEHKLPAPEFLAPEFWLLAPEWKYLNLAVYNKEYKGNHDMNHAAKSLRAFIGAKNFEESRQFYKELGFEESPIDATMSYFKVTDALGFYLQDAYVEDWINNLMLFLEVDDVHRYWKELQSLGLHQKYKGVRLTPIREESWGRECFMHDPSGVLWHFGEFHQA